MTATVLRGDARALPLPDASVDLIVTSPPYWALRSYTDGGEHYNGQIGAEPTPAAYIDSLIDCTREWMRVLKPTGSLWVNLGDKYSGAQAQNFGGTSHAGDSAKTWQLTNPANTGIRAKSLIGLPWRYALRCIDDLGLILRAEIIWSKPNGLPESVTDRVRRSHEQWFHFVRSPRYFSAVDAIREPHAPWTLKAYAYEQKNGGYNRRANPNRVDEGDASDYAVANPLGKLPSSVWEIATQPLKVPAELGIDHFAAFPMEWPRRIIRGWSPSGICTACGEGRRPVASAEALSSRRHTQSPQSVSNGTIDLRGGLRALTEHAQNVVRTITGEACACPDASAPTHPSVIVDPFGGTGTTALLADVLGRHGISVDHSSDYCRLAAWRTTDPGQRAAALEVEKPAAPIEGQLALFGGA